MTTFTAWAAKTPKTWTDAAVIRIAPPADLDRSDVFLPHPDVPRLFIRFRRAAAGHFGAGTYTAIYCRGGDDRRIPLGKVGAITVAAARAKAMELFAAAHDPTRDPAAERADAKAAHGHIFRALVPDYIRLIRSKGLKRRYVDKVERYLTHYFPGLDALQVNLIKREHCARAIDALLQPGPAWTGGRATATEGRSALSAYFGWLIRQGKTEINPVDHTERYSNPSRDHYLSEAELGRVLRTLDTSARFDRIVKLLILTGCRRDQIGQLQRSWIDLDGPIPVINFPGEAAANRAETYGDSKNGKPFTIPLSRQAVALLRAQLADPKAGEVFIFGRRGAGAGFGNFSEALAGLHKRVGEGVRHWSLHDLRRTFLTLGVERLPAFDTRGMSLPVLLDASINHTPSSLAVSEAGKAYQRATLLEGRVPLAQAWADYCDGIAQPAPPKLQLVA